MSKRLGEIHIIIEFGGNLSFLPYLMALYSFILKKSHLAL
jgi:hypothetical protein